MDFNIEDRAIFKLLVADKSAFTRNVIKSTLKGVDVEVEEASQGEEGLEKIKTLKPNMIIVDNDIPGFGGNKFIREIRNNPEISSTYILMLSKDANGGPRVVFGPKANAVLPKPFQENQIKAQISKGISALKNPDTIFKDPLTHLGNSISLYENIQNIKSDFRDNMQDLSLLLIEIDNFKALEKNHGPNWSRNLLFRFSEIINSHNDPDVSAYNLEKGFFSCLATNGGVNKCLSLSESITAALMATPLSRKEEITLSMGIKNASTADECKMLLPHAQEALLDAQSLGPNNVEVYYSF